MKWKSLWKGDLPPNEGETDYIGLFIIKDKNSVYHSAFRLACDMSRANFKWISTDGKQNWIDDEVIDWLELPNMAGEKIRMDKAEFDMKRVEMGAKQKIKIMAVSVS